jgi:hypothetical protein
MSRQQYLKLLEKEIHELNKKIDQKILRGEAYYREARDHKLLLRKVRQNRPSTSIFSRFIPALFQF